MHQAKPISHAPRPITWRAIAGPFVALIEETARAAPPDETPGPSHLISQGGDRLRGSGECRGLAEDPTKALLDGLDRQP